MNLWNRKPKDDSPAPPPPPVKVDQSQQHKGIVGIVARQETSYYSGSTYNNLALIVTLPDGESEVAVTSSHSSYYGDIALCRKGDRVHVTLYRADQASPWKVVGTPEIILDVDQLREELKSAEE